MKDFIDAEFEVISHHQPQPWRWAWLVFLIALAGFTALVGLTGGDIDTTDDPPSRPVVVYPVRAS